MQVLNAWFCKSSKPHLTASTRYGSAKICQSVTGHQKNCSFLKTVVVNTVVLWFCRKEGSVTCHEMLAEIRSSSHQLQQLARRRLRRRPSRSTTPGSSGLSLEEASFLQPPVRVLYSLLLQERRGAEESIFKPDSREAEAGPKPLLHFCKHGWDLLGTKSHGTTTNYSFYLN